jgi:hypothetical protein
LPLQHHSWSVKALDWTTASSPAQKKSSTIRCIRQTPGTPSRTNNRTASRPEVSTETEIEARSFLGATKSGRRPRRQTRLAGCARARFRARSSGSVATSAAAAARPRPAPPTAASSFAANRVRSSGFRQVKTGWSDSRRKTG